MFTAFQFARSVYHFFSLHTSWHVGSAVCQILWITIHAFFCTSHESRHNLERMKKQIDALRAAFPDSLPVMAGYLFLGMAYGVYMNVSGFAWYYPFFMSVFIFGGSLQFFCVTLLMSRFAPLTAFVMALIIQARHLFYSLAMLDKYRDAGRLKPYLIFALTDETFAVVNSKEIPEGIDRRWYYFFLSLLDQSYWVAGSVLGGVFGSFLPFDTAGIEFVMTAMFVVIFLENWIKEKSHISSLVGIFVSLACLILSGSESFIIPSLSVILVFLLLLRKNIEKAGDPL